MKILAVSYRSPWPTNRGDAMRLTGFLRALADNHDVACCSPRLTADARNALAGFGIETHACEVKPGNVRHWLGAPAQVLAWAPWQVPRRLLERTDVVHLSTLRSVPLVPRPFLRECHLDYVDALSLNTIHRARASGWLRPLWDLEARRLHRLEADVGAEVRTASCTTDWDGAAIGRPGTAVVPFGVSGPDLPSTVGHRPSIAFTGNLGYFPNVDAAKWLARDIFPRVQARVPDCVLTLVGARPSNAVRELSALPGVELHGDVADIGLYIDAAWVVVAPLRLGTGLQTKVLEGLAHWRPVVTTPTVAERIQGAVPGVNLEVGDTAESLAEALVRLLLDAPLRTKMGAAAHQLAAQYRWDVCAASLEAAYAR